MESLLSPPPVPELTKSVIARIGPEKGVIHIATGAVGNAIWDMYARSRSKPLWKLVVDMTPVRLSILVARSGDGENLRDPLGGVSPFDNFPVHHRRYHSRRSLEVVEGKRGWQDRTRS